MLFFLFFAAEVLLVGGGTVLLTVLPISVLFPILYALILTLLLILQKPALFLSRYVTERRRRVLHRSKRKAGTAEQLVLPSALPPACLTRLMEGAGALKPFQAKTIALLATLLELNCRGLIQIRMDEETETTISMEPQALQQIRENGTAFERQLLHILHGITRPAHSVRLSIFVEYAATHCRMLQWRTDRFFCLVDRYLQKNGYFQMRRLRRRHFAWPPVHRLVLTPKAVRELGEWSAYLGALCAHPTLASYPEDIDRFEKELERAFVYAAAGGIFSVARENLLREFLFAPQSIWNEEQYLWRVAYSDDALQTLLYNVLHKIICYGTRYYHADDWEEDLEEAREVT